MRNCLAYNLLEWGEAGAREQLSDSGPAPPFLDDARPFQGLHLRYHSFRFRQWGEGDVDCYCTPSAQALEHLRKRPLTYLVSVSFFCIVVKKNPNTSRAAKIMNNPCRQLPTDADETAMAMATEPTPKKANGRKRARVVTTTARSPSPIPKQPAVLDLLPVPCAGSILGDDLILCRLSALLPPTDLERLQLHATSASAAAAANASSRSAGAGSSRSSASASASASGSRSTGTTTSRRRHRRSASTTSASSAEGNDAATDATTTADTDTAAAVAAGGGNRRTTRSGRTTLRRPTNTKGAKSAKSSAGSLVKSSLVRKVSSTLTDEEDSGSNTCSKGGGGGTSFSLIPGDVAVVLPPELRHPSEISSSSSTAGSCAGSGNGNRNNTATAAAAAAENSNPDIHHSPTTSTTSNTNTAMDNPLQHLLRSVGIEEVEALDPTRGGPTAGQCQFACVATALSRSYGTGGQGQPLLRDNYRPDLELRRLALHVIRMNPELYRNFLTVAGGQNAQALRGRRFRRRPRGLPPDHGQPEL